MKNQEKYIFIIANCTWYIFNFRIDLLEKIKTETDEFAKGELLPKFEGRQMVMVLAPK